MRLKMWPKLVRISILRYLKDLVAQTKEKLLSVIECDFIKVYVECYTFRQISFIIAEKSKFLQNCHQS